MVYGCTSMFLIGDAIQGNPWAITKPVRNIPISDREIGIFRPVGYLKLEILSTYK